jgi:hypothetical protein
VPPVLSPRLRGDWKGCFDQADQHVTFQGHAQALACKAAQGLECLLDLLRGRGDVLKGAGEGQRECLQSAVAIGHDALRDLDGIGDEVAEIAAELLSEILAQLIVARLRHVGKRRIERARFTHARRIGGEPVQCRRQARRHQGVHPRKPRIGAFECLEGCEDLAYILRGEIAGLRLIALQQPLARGLWREERASRSSSPSKISSSNAGLANHAGSRARPSHS